MPDKKSHTRDLDPTAAERKADHIELAFQSQVAKRNLDSRFDYEPMLTGHPEKNSLVPHNFGGKKMRVPIWVSSMTGGTEEAYRINHNLARACSDFGMGMGLGSCRSLLEDTSRLKDFDVRNIMGDEVPLFANLGVAQIETLLDEGREKEIEQLVNLLRADGLIIHVNPLQEWLQPEGDHFLQPPLTIITAVLDSLPNLPLIVKEVGQGMGPKSVKALLRLPLLALDTAAGGGTNFSKLELFRREASSQQIFSPLTVVGHTAQEMVEMVNQHVMSSEQKVLCQNLIVSGGVRNFMDGYYLIQKAALPSVYGQASAFLKHARGDYKELQSYVSHQIRGLELAYAYLRLREK